MNKKIESQFAIGIILFVAIIAGGTVWISSMQYNQANEYLSVQTDLLNKQVEFKKTEVKETAEQSLTENNCTPHYYEGEVALQGWLAVNNQSDSDGVIVQLKKGEAEKLPLNDSQPADDFTVRLIDPTDEIKKELSDSTLEKPATITIRGYAEVCSQQPLVSVLKATVAFKKS
jgi:hypothetical protein